VNAPHFGCSCRNLMHFFCGVKSAKRFVNVHLYSIVSNLKRMQIVDFAPLENFLRTPVCTFHQYCFCITTKTFRVLRGALVNFVGVQNGGVFDSSNRIVFCLVYRVLKHKKTNITKTLGGMAPPVPYANVSRLD